MRLKTFLLVALFPFPALAQAPQADIQAQAQALSQKLMQEINSGLQCQSNAIGLQAALQKETDEVKRLTDKYEHKDATPAPPKKP